MGVPQVSSVGFEDTSSMTGESLEDDDPRQKLNTFQIEGKAWAEAGTTIFFLPTSKDLILYALVSLRLRPPRKTGLFGRISTLDAISCLVEIKMVSNSFYLLFIAKPDIKTLPIMERCISSFR